MLLKGKNALLLAEGCKLNKQKKELEKRLEAIKEEMGLKDEGTYTNEAGDELNIAEVEKFTDIEPKKVLTWLKNNGMSARFSECVKVQLTPLKKLVPESVYTKWRKPLDPSTRWTWK